MRRFRPNWNKLCRSTLTDVVLATIATILAAINELTDEGSSLEIPLFIGNTFLIAVTASLTAYNSYLEIENIAALRKYKHLAYKQYGVKNQPPDDGVPTGVFFLTGLITIATPILIGVMAGLSFWPGGTQKTRKTYSNLIGTILPFFITTIGFFVQKGYRELAQKELDEFNNWERKRWLAGQGLVLPDNINIPNFSTFSNIKPIHRKFWSQFLCRKALTKKRINERLGRAKANSTRLDPII